MWRCRDRRAGLGPDDRHVDRQRPRQRGRQRLVPADRADRLVDLHPGDRRRPRPGDAVVVPARTSDISGTITVETSGGFPLLGPPAGTILQLLNSDGTPALDSVGNPSPQRQPRRQLPVRRGPGGAVPRRHPPASRLDGDRVAANLADASAVSRPASTSSSGNRSRPPRRPDGGHLRHGHRAELRGRPVEVPPNTKLVLFDADGNFATFVSGGPDGSYLFDDVPPGVYTVRIFPGRRVEVVGPQECLRDATAGDVTGVDFLIREPPPTTEPRRRNRRRRNRAPHATATDLPCSTTRGARSPLRTPTTPRSHRHHRRPPPPGCPPDVARPPAQRRTRPCRRSAGSR